MNEIAVKGHKRMTVKEVAEVLGYKADTIQGKVKELFPDIIKNGVATYLNEEQVYIIKKSLTPRNLGLKSEVENAVTELEMQERAVSVMSWMQGKIQTLTLERDEAIRRNAILMHVGKTYTATELAKELNLKSATEFNELLVQKKIQYKVNDTWVLKSDFANLGYTSIKQSETASGRIVYNREFTQDGRKWILDLFVDLFE